MVLVIEIFKHQNKELLIFFSTVNTMTADDPTMQETSGGIDQIPQTFSVAPFTNMV